MSRVITPASSRSESRPEIRYLYSGDVSKNPALFRTAKYSCFGDMPYLSADRYPDQWPHRCVVLSSASRSWNGVVLIIADLSRCRDRGTCRDHN